MKTILPPKRGEVDAPVRRDNPRTRIDTSPTTQQGFQNQLREDGDAGADEVSVGEYINNRGSALEDQLRDRPPQPLQQQWQQQPQQQPQQQQRFADSGYTQSAQQSRGPPPKQQPDSSMMQIFDAMQQ
jgi:transcription initiation factor TFIID subunit TAF12